MKYLTLVTLAACTFVAGCMSYTERTIVQKPVPAQPVVYTTQPAAATTTTAVSVNYPRRPEADRFNHADWLNRGRHDTMDIGGAFSACHLSGRHLSGLRTKPCA